MRFTTIVSTLASLLLLTSTACDEQKKDAKQSEAEAKAEEKAPAKKDPKELFASEKPELPGPLATLEFGMAPEEVKKAAPSVGDGYEKAEEYEETYFGYYVPEDSGKLKSARVVVEAEGFDLEKVLTEAWGEPKKGEDLGKPKLYWFNPEKKVRATISQGFGKEKEVQFEQYLPAKELLGEGKETLGVEDHPLLGATYDDLTTHYKEHLEVLTQEQAQKQRERMEKMTGKDLSALGDAVATSNIDLPPTEFGSQFTRIHPTFEDGKIARYRVQIDYKPYPEAKDEILGFIKEKWGEPKEEEKYGKKLLVFNKNPRVVVEDDDISKAWDIEIEQGE